MCKTLGDKVFIIAEAGVNHNGNLDTAKKLVDAAVESKADAVKFQTFKAEKLVTKSADKAEYQKETTGKGETQYGMLKRLELSYENHVELYKYCREKEIMFLSTPFDCESADLLENLSVSMFKISSGDLTNMPFLKYIAQKNKPMILSTGMANLGEVEEAVDWIKGEGNNEIILLHCTSNYPTNYKDVNLKSMETMREAFKLPVGYSDHTPGIEVSIGAVALGACVIEKHFTLDKTMEGPDHKASLNPEELREMIRCIRNVEVSLGTGIKKCNANEEEVKKIARKSIVAAKHISRGERIQIENITLKRPETGINPSYYEQIIGYYAVTDIEPDTPLNWDLIRNERYK